MSELTLPQLLALDPGALHTAAESWRKLALDLEVVTHEYATATRVLPDAWQGSAADAATAKLSRLHRDLFATENPALAISRALTTGAEHFTTLRHEVQRHFEDAENAGYSINRTTCEITAPSDTENASRRRAGDPTMTYHHLLTLLSDVLTRARQTDDETTQALAANTPTADGRLGATLTDRTIDKSAVEAQRGRKPAKVRAWWDNLTPQERQEAITDYPGLIGWLDGIPADARDQANRITLAAERDAITTQRADANTRLTELYRIRAEATRTHQRLDDPGALGDEIWRLEGTIAGLDAKSALLDKVNTGINRPGDPPIFLLGIDSAGDGKALISVGSPDTARNTAVLVPGMDNTLKDMYGGDSPLVERAERLREQADRIAGGSGQTAVVTWLGYDTPEVSLNGSAIGSDRARTGGLALDQFVDGLRVTHDGTPTHLTAVGHSYGTTVIGQATQVGTLAVDDIVTAGSPGMDVDHAKDLHLDPRHVYVGVASDDPVPRLGVYVHGDAPSSYDFGANRYSVDTSGHSGYWEPNSQSLYNQSAVIAGQYDKVDITQKAHS